LLGLQPDNQIKHGFKSNEACPTLDAGFLEPALEAGFLAVVERGLADARDAGLAVLEAGFAGDAWEAGFEAALDAGFDAALDSGLA